MPLSLDSLALVSLLKEHFDLNLARLKCLVLIIFSLMETKSVNLAQLAGFFPSKTTPQSRYRRLQRFMKEVKFLPQKLAPLILTIMGIDPAVKLTLILDRTNWKFGKKDLNILYLAVAHQGLAIPLFWLILRDKKKEIQAILIV